MAYSVFCELQGKKLENQYKVETKKQRQRQKTRNRFMYTSFPNKQKRHTFKFE